MDKELAIAVKETLIENGFDVSVREYSGRFMYGKKTWPVSGDFTLTNVIEAFVNYPNLFLDSDGEPFYEVRNIKWV